VSPAPQSYDETMPKLDHGAGKRMLAKACLTCGYRGASIQGRRRALRCPGCGADLYSRPPRSYAELEGFVPESVCDDEAADFRADFDEDRGWPALRRVLIRAAVIALIITPPLVVVGAAGAFAAVWMLRR